MTLHDMLNTGPLAMWAVRAALVAAALVVAAAAADRTYAWWRHR